MPTTIEFWPEYGDGPLWSSEGDALDPSTLGLASDLIHALTAWNGSFGDSKLPFEQDDRAWIEEGVRLLAAVRMAVGDNYKVVVTEPWWRDEPNA